MTMSDAARPSHGASRRARRSTVPARRALSDSETRRSRLRAPRPPGRRHGRRRSPAPGATAARRSARPPRWPRRHPAAVPARPRGRAGASSRGRRGSRGTSRGARGGRRPPGPPSDRAPPAAPARGAGRRSARAPRRDPSGSSVGLRGGAGRRPVAPPNRARWSRSTTAAEPLPELGHRPPGPRLDGPERPLESLGDLGLREVHRVAEHDHLALVLGQLGDARPDDGLDPAAPGDLARIGRRRRRPAPAACPACGAPAAAASVVNTSRRTASRDGRRPSARSRSIARWRAIASSQVSSEPDRGVEQARPSPERDERVLDDLGGHLPVAQEAGDRAEQEARVPVVRDHERALIARGDARRQPSVVERRRVVRNHPSSVVRTGRWSAPVSDLSSGSGVARECRPAQ